jgi:HD-GYP domain-containing protein (c-di-GMP phosphodiesterase class II)
MPSLEILEGAGSGQCFELAATTYLGRLSDEAKRLPNFVGLPDNGVSRLHARIVQRDARFLLEDLNSTNGTLLQGKRLQPRMPYVLADADVVRICSTALRFRADQPVRAEHGPPFWEEWSRAIADSVSGRPDISAAPTGTLRLVRDDDHPPAFTAVVDASTRALSEQTSQPTAQGQLAEALRKMQAMVQVSLTLGATTERGSLLQRVVDVALSLFPAAERVLVLLQAREGGVPVPVAATRRNGNWGKSEPVPLSRTIIRHVLRERRAVLWRTDMGYQKFHDPGESIVSLSPYSVMCSPLLAGDEILGLMQVDTPRSDKTFAEEDLQILAAISAQVAISLKNAAHYAEIEDLFDGFIRASIRAIESRDPTTAGHSFRVAELTERLAHEVDHTERYGLAHVHFTADEMRELRYAALLHDFGKIGVREHVLNKEKKLYPHQMALVRERSDLARARIEGGMYREFIEAQLVNPPPPQELGRLWQKVQRDVADEEARIERFVDAIERANEPADSSQDLFSELLAAAHYSITDTPGEAGRLLDSAELACLSLARGNLTAEERSQMQSHVSHTFAFLSLIPWTGPLARIPEFAYAHHERLDGSGYPRGLKAEDLAPQVRILSIADVYDALRSGDRPYRPSMPDKAALAILRSEAEAGKLDAALVELFIESKAYLAGQQDLV